MARPLFVFGIARSGTNLIGRMLNAHPDVALALDPLLPLFRRVRDRWVAEDGRPELAAFASPGSPLHDGYGHPLGPELLDLVLNGDLAFRMTDAERQMLRADLATRAALESPSLAKALADVDGVTYGDFLSAVLERVAEAKGTTHYSWAGVKEVWSLDFLPALARAFPDAGFIVIERDPRGVLASLEALAQKDPGQRGHAGSYLRHWRKGIVLTRHFERDPFLAPRILTMRYEEVARDPQHGAAAICRHLGLSDPTWMQSPERQIDPATGRGWIRNSSFGAEDGRIVADSIHRWQTFLDSAQQRYVRFYTAPEMVLAGYSQDPREPLCPDILGKILDADRRPGVWRSDSGGVLSDIGLEALRQGSMKECLGMPSSLLRQCFLFDWVPGAIGECRESGMITADTVSAATSDSTSCSVERPFP